MTGIEVTRADPEPGLYISINIDHVTKRRDPATLRDVIHVETLADATDQRFSPFVMAATLRAIADEIDPKRAPLPNF